MSTALVIPPGVRPFLSPRLVGSSSVSTPGGLTKILRDPLISVHHVSCAPSSILSSSAWSSQHCQRDGARVLGPHHEGPGPFVLSSIPTSPRFDGFCGQSCTQCLLLQAVCDDGPAQGAAHFRVALPAVSAKVHVACILQDARVHDRGYLQNGTGRRLLHQLSALRCYPHPPASCYHLHSK